MNKEMKKIKFSVLIEDIKKNSGRRTGEGLYLNMLGLSPMNRMHYSINTSTVTRVGPLSLIFDNKNSNDYLKEILSEVKFTSLNWSDEYSKTEFNDVSKKIVATKDLIEELIIPDRENELIEFIFWSLFALSVDKTNYEEKVSLISDFTHVLGISEEILKDIILVIRVIFGEEDKGFKFSTDKIPDVFSEVLKLFQEDNFQLSD